MNAIWRSYVPYHVAQELSQRPNISPIGQVRRFSAVALFSDVSGFTPISEALGKTGKAGAEELTAILNSYFTPMIQLIHSYGGIIGKFGGDAVTVLFPFTRRTQKAVVRRALQCTLEMQANMERYESMPTSAGYFSLAMKAGLALGPILSTTIGDPAIRLEYIIAGSPLDLCAEAEHHASSGEVVVHHELLNWTGAVEITEERDGFSCVTRLKRRAKPSPLANLGPIPAEAAVTLSKFLHPIIAHRLQAGLEGFINEHRKVTVLFVSFSGFDYDHDPEVVSGLQRYLSTVIRIVQQYDGYLNKVDMGDKGSKYIVLFGAPVIHENDEERAMHCALDLGKLADCETRIGINTGFVYCGQVGSAARQEYTVIGDTVNLAARLMQAARSGQILVSGTTWRSVATAFTWEEFAPIKVKGKLEPIPIFALRNRNRQAVIRLQEPAYEPPLVGREAELEQVQDKIERAWRGRGQIVGITGEAGLGKSRLGTEIIRRATAQGFTVFGGACQSYGLNISYLVWRDIWRGFFGLDPAWPPEEQHRRLEGQLATIDASLLQRLPLLGAVLNISLPDNELTRSSDSEFRTELLKSLLLTCLRRRTRQTPLLIVLEDCHWLDPLSQELLEFIGRNIADLPLLIISIFRPPDHRHNPLAWATRLSHYSQIALVEFTPAEAKQLIRFKLKQLFGLDRDAPDDLMEQIFAKAQGNPFYIEEILNYMNDRGLNPQDFSRPTALNLPDSLHSLILSRIDQHAEREKTTLKVASIIGRVFKASWLWGSYPALGSPEMVKRYLETLSRLDITPLEKPEPELEYLFKHITIQEVAYDSLAFALRETLHEAVGQFIEQAYPHSLAQYLDILAYHYGRSPNVAKQRHYFRQAGDAAKAAYANEAAIDYYQRLLLLLPDREKVDVLRHLGEVWQVVGRWSDAQNIFQQSLDLAQSLGDKVALAHCQNALGHLLSHTESYQEALIWLEKARENFEQLDEPIGLCRTLEYLSFIYAEQGDYAQALTYSEQQHQIAGEAGDEIGVSAALGNIGVAYWNRGDYHQAQLYLDQALEIAIRIGYQRGAILTGSDLAGLYWQLGDYYQAVTGLQQALRVAAEIGDLRNIGMIVGNAGEIYRLRGDYDQALANYGQALHMAVELGDWTMIPYTVGNIAIVCAAQKQFQEAEKLYRQAIALGRALNVPQVLCEDLYHYARLCTLQQRYTEAYRLNQEAHDLAVQVSRKDIQFPANLLAIRLQIALTQIDPKVAANDLKTLANTWSEDREQATIHYELWRLDKSCGEAHQVATHLYRHLYHKTFNIEYRQRYEEMTGERLTDPPPLPQLSDHFEKSSVNLADLLQQVDILVEDLLVETAQPIV